MAQAEIIDQMVFHDVDIDAERVDVAWCDECGCVHLWLVTDGYALAGAALEAAQVEALIEMLRAVRPSIN